MSNMFRKEFFLRIGFLITGILMIVIATVLFWFSERINDMGYKSTTVYGNLISFISKNDDINILDVLNKTIHLKVVSPDIYKQAYIHYLNILGKPVNEQSLSEINSLDDYNKKVKASNLEISNKELIKLDNEIRKYQTVQTILFSVLVIVQILNVIFGFLLAKLNLKR